MAKRYAIWNKQDSILTPVGKIYTAKEWIEKYPIAGLDNITVVCGAGEINGSFFGTLNQMIQAHEGIDFSNCKTNEEILEKIEEAEDTPDENVSNEELTATSLASIAASLEYQNMLTLEDVGE